MKMKIQRILTATLDHTKHKCDVILAFNDRNEFITWLYKADVKYFTGHYFETFNAAYDDFMQRISENGGALCIEYFARQIGQAEIIWEEL